MKNIILLIMVAFTFVSCEKDAEITEETICIYHVDNVQWNQYSGTDENGEPFFWSGYAVEYHLSDGTYGVELVPVNEYQDWLENDEYCD